jgi:hypothetical protein
MARVAAARFAKFVDTRYFITTMSQAPGIAFAPGAPVAAAVAVPPSFEWANILIMLYIAFFGVVQLCTIVVVDQTCWQQAWVAAALLAFALQHSAILLGHVMFHQQWRRCCCTQMPRCHVVMVWFAALFSCCGLFLALGVAVVLMSDGGGGGVVCTSAHNTAALLLVESASMFGALVYWLTVAVTTTGRTLVTRVLDAAPVVDV